MLMASFGHIVLLRRPSEQLTKIYFYRNQVFFLYPRHKSFFFNFFNYLQITQ